jgi:hypothetical protein
VMMDLGALDQLDSAVEQVYGKDLMKKLNERLTKEFDGRRNLQGHVSTELATLLKEELRALGMNFASQQPRRRSPSLQAKTAFRLFIEPDPRRQERVDLSHCTRAPERPLFAHSGRPRLEITRKLGARHCRADPPQLLRTFCCAPVRSWLKGP